MPQGTMNFNIKTKDALQQDNMLMSLSFYWILEHIEDAIPPPPISHPDKTPAVEGKGC